MMMTNLEKILSAAVPALTIIGLIVLLAMNKIDQTTGIALIGTLAGGHAGATLVSSGARQGAAQASVAASAAPSATARRGPTA